MEIDAEIAKRLTYIEFERARLLHIGDPGEVTVALCGRDGVGEPAGSDAGDRGVCKGCTDQAQAIVVVKKPNPATGEVTVELVAPNRYRRPATDPVVSRRFAQRVLAGEKPTLTYPRTEPCPVEPGDVIRLSANVSIEIGTIGFIKGKGDHRVSYKVIDDRPVLIRRTPPMYEPPAVDATGKPKGLSKAEEEATGITSSYTQDPKQAVPATAPEVDVEYRRVISVKKRTKKATKEREGPMSGTDEDVKKATEEMGELAKRAAKMGLNPTEVLAPIFRSIEQAHADISAPAGDDEQRAA